MDIVNTVYQEFNSLGTSLGFGAFEGGVIYLSVFSLIIFKSIDVVKDVLDNKKKKEDKTKDHHEEEKKNNQENLIAIIK